MENIMMNNIEIIQLMGGLIIFGLIFYIAYDFYKESIIPKKN